MPFSCQLDVDGQCTITASCIDLEDHDPEHARWAFQIDLVLDGDTSARPARRILTSPALQALADAADPASRDDAYAYRWAHDVHPTVGPVAPAYSIVGGTGLASSPLGLLMPAAGAADLLEGTLVHDPIAVTQPLTLTGSGLASSPLGLLLPSLAPPELATEMWGSGLASSPLGLFHGGAASGLGGAGFDGLD